MKLTVVALAIGVAAGTAAGGRVANLASVRVRWPFLALAGFALQVVPAPGRVWPLVLLYVSFTILLVFAMANLRRPGFALILIGIALNLTVIAVNSGMPVTRHALEASGQRDTLTLLIREGGAKHHLASSSDVLVPLADSIPIAGVDQAVSVGDLTMYTGLIWLIVSAMRRRSPVEAGPPGELVTSGGARVAG